MPSRDFPVPTDLLGEVLHLLRLTGTLYCRAELTAPWGVAVPRLDELMTFQVVTSGRCVLEVDGAGSRVLEQGSLTLIPHGTPHRLRSAPGTPTEPLFDIPVERISDRYEVLRHGGGGDLTQVAYGAVRFDHLTAHRLVRQLPLVLHVDAWDDDAAGWLHSTLRFMAAEARTPRAGGETVITRLADILVVQAIRSWLDSAPEADQGWLAAVRDEHVGRALLSIHRAPEHPWTVAELAGQAHLSRSAFAARFTALVGEPAMRYLTECRMQLARARLRETAEPLSTVAHSFGYRSEAAFSRAFKRAFGVPPGSLRRPAAPAMAPG
ncbi:AraC family transcriptional regulator [Saccharothrix sp. NRRL B-16314]|uniref:AraC family transcriptional regulator n=1 Tax=Saccharothrix sp. NRRL B-16314 TaxID=1463825 RepID=UPI0005248C00|nr:AraC family transcriptional regulator [Saccharothrix sp. NRRL B-16314]